MMLPLRALLGSILLGWAALTLAGPNDPPSRKGPYLGMPPPGDQPVRFAPDVITTPPGVHSAAVFAHIEGRLRGARTTSKPIATAAFATGPTCHS